MTTITYELDLTQFKFWAGGEDNAKEFSYSDLEQLNDWFNANYDSLSECEVNDMFWLEPDMLAQALGYSDFEAMIDGEDDDEEDDEDENDKWEFLDDEEEDKE